MGTYRNNWLRGAGAGLLLALLAACGGGTTSGGGGPGTTPPPPPPTNPNLPPPTNVPSSFNTDEFHNADGPGLHNAVAGWSRGYTGDGVTIALIDNGIDSDSPEFAGRISPLSRDMTGNNRPLTGDGEHGTNVAMTAAAARDGRGILGMAYDARILALRADQPGSCVPGSEASSGCSFAESVIAQSVTFAASNGAKVINISLSADGASAFFVNAVANAVASGALVVIAAGNDSSTDPSGLSAALAAGGNGGVIIAGSIDDDGSMSDFSNRAGNSRDHFLAALGGGVCCVYKDGVMVVENGFATLFAGTSFATPQITGAAALLAEAYPTLTGAQIAGILFDSAFDAGVVGVDAEFGNGILDIAAALRPIGTTSLAGGNTTIALTDSSGTSSPAMGDALSTASLQGIVLDKYDRAFEVDFAAGMQLAAITPRLTNALESRQRDLSLGIADTTLGFTVEQAMQDDLAERLAPGYRAGHDAYGREVLSARIATDLDPQTQLAMGYRQEATGLVAHLQGQNGAAFMLAPSALHDEGFFRRSDAALAVRHVAGGWGLTASAERGHVPGELDWPRTPSMRGLASDDRISGYGLAADRSFGPLGVALGLSVLDEQRTILGGRFHDAFGIGGARTIFTHAAMSADLDANWSIAGQFRRGSTSVYQAGLVAQGSGLSSQAWSFDLERRGVFAGSDALAVRIAQPLRVTGGSLDLMLPVSYSYSTLQPGYGLRSLALAPEGREIMGELAWRGKLLSGQASASLFYRSEPGHFEEMPSDKGAALRWSREF